jgi:hypothetical protein
MKVGISAFYLLFFSIVIHPHPAIAACNPQTDELCCASDSDCVVIAHKKYCSPLSVNKTAAEKLEKEIPTPLGACTEESITKLKDVIKGYKSVCVSQMCEFKLPGESEDK